MAGSAASYSGGPRFESNSLSLPNPCTKMLQRYRMSPLSCRREWQLYRKGRQHPPGHPMTAAVLRNRSTIKWAKRKANWIGHILRRNCLLKQVIEGKIKGELEVTRRRGRRRKKRLDDLKDRRGYSHWKEEALDRTTWRNRFGRGVGPVVRQNTE
jgi:hypothetical protein